MDASASSECCACCSCARSSSVRHVTLGTFSRRVAAACLVSTRARYQLAILGMRLDAPHYQRHETSLDSIYARAVVHVSMQKNRFHPTTGTLLMLDHSFTWGCRKNSTQSYLFPRHQRPATLVPISF